MLKESETIKCNVESSQMTKQGLFFCAVMLKMWKKN